MDRRTLLGLSLAATVATAARAEEGVATGDHLPGDPVETLPLWPGTPPGGEAVHLTLEIQERSATPDLFHDRFVAHVAEPILTVVRPDRPDGSALLVIPGGAYRRIVFDNEGLETARRAAGSGVTAFILRYRLPAEGWANGADVPLQDAQRAMRLIRASIDTFGLDPSRIGVIGFSAGGHVAASLLTRSEETVYEPVDGIDRMSAVPDFAGLIYPVISMIPPLAHAGSHANLLGSGPAEDREVAYSPDRHVVAGLAPTFLALAADDPVVDPANSLQMFASLRAARVPSELHVFEEGGHGFGIRLAQGKPAAAWPDLFVRWATRHGMIKPPAA